jgi:hypothetical protein
MPNGDIVEFSSKEFWRENFSTNKEGSPNAMWKKRPYAQLAKCAEAQALRKAFPDILDQFPTAEEMEGKTFDGEYSETKPLKAEVNELNEKLGLNPQYDMTELCKSINEAPDLLILEMQYKLAYKTARNNADHINVLTELKDKRKAELTPQPPKDEKAIELDQSWEEFKKDETI